MASTRPDASSCYLTEAARSLRAAIDAEPDADATSSRSHSSSETLVEDGSAENKADTSPQASEKQTTPSISTADANKHQPSKGKPSNSDDTDIVYHPKLRQTIGIPDLGLAMDRLITVPNDIIKEHYGDRIRFSTEFGGSPYAMAWSIKADDVLDPIAIVVRWAQNGSLDVVQKVDKGDGTIGVKNHPERTHNLTVTANNIREKYGCDRVGFYDGVDLVLFTFYTTKSKSKSKPDGHTHLIVGWLDEIRSKLMSWLGEALRNTTVQMLKPLTGYTLKDSNLEALALDTPPQRYLHDKHVDKYMAGRPLFPATVTFGEDEFTMYTTAQGKVLKTADGPLPTVDDRELTTPEGVLESCRYILLKFLICVGKEQIGNELKHSFDLVPDALTWYVRDPDDRRAKELVGIIQFSPAGTIVPGDWGLRKPDLTFTNGEGIVRTAKPLLEGMLSFGLKRECYSLALFDYHSVVFVTRCKGTKVNASIALITGDRIRGALVQWLLRALEISEDTYTAVS